MHILFALPGLHRFDRGAEVVLESVAQQIALHGAHQVTLVGSGGMRPARSYDFIHIPAVSRERFEQWPRMPFLRHEFMYEELTFAAGLAALPAVASADITMTCSYPYTNWALRRPRVGGRPRHVFVTQNGDWPALGRGPEPWFFSCDGLICTNPLYFERNRERWKSALIPNGIDPARFRPGPTRKTELGLPVDRPLVLMVSALEPGKRVIEAMKAVADVPDTFLLVAGDGPLRDQVDILASEILPGRFLRRTFKHEQMPDLYRSADLFLHTKIRESFGNVYVEALSCGAPIIAHDDEVTRWILGKHAVLVDCESQDELTTAIRKTLHGRIDRAAAARWAHEICRVLRDGFRLLDARSPHDTLEVRGLSLSRPIITTDSGIRAAIVGTGYIAEFHARGIANADGVELVAVCDVNAAAAAAFGGAWSVPSFASLEEMLAECRVDAIHLAVPPDLHFRLAKTALGAGVSLFVEKPMCVCTEETHACRDRGRSSAGAFCIHIEAAHTGTACEVTAGGDVVARNGDTNAVARTESAICVLCGGAEAAESRAANLGTIRSVVK
jgi:glycosyltransferase involved in cell wall biosynthesis